MMIILYMLLLWSHKFYINQYYKKKKNLTLTNFQLVASEHAHLNAIPDPI